MIKLPKRINEKEIKILIGANYTISVFTYKSKIHMLNSHSFSFIRCVVIYLEIKYN